MYLNKKFEMEYNGEYYTVDAEYIIERDMQSHSFGTRVLESIIPVGFVVFCNGGLFVPIESDLKDAIWRECDRYADTAQ